MHLSIERKMFIGFALAMMIMVGLLVLSYHSAIKFLDATRRLPHTQEILFQLESALSTLKDIETGERGYVITGNERFLEPHRLGIERIDQYLTRLRELTRNNPQQQRRLDFLEPLILQQINVVSRIIEKRREKGFAAARKLVDLEEERFALDEIRLLIGDIMNQEKELLQLQASRFEMRARTMLVLIPLGSVLALTMVMVWTLIARREVHRRRWTEEALQVAQAEFARVSRAMLMGEMVASIAHEINQPLAAIAANGNACLQWLSNPAPEIHEVRESLQDMVGQASRASAVIARIRSFIKRQPMQPVPLDINEVIRDVVALATYDVRRHHVAIRTDLTEGLPPVVGDRVGLQQVVLNLIRNGIEAMETTSEGARDLVVQSSRNESNEVLVAVRDAGSGLPSENVDRIFVPFFTTKPNGMGMGLSISRSIIEAHGGTLWATPNEDRGATFRFTLQAK